MSPFAKAQAQKDNDNKQEKDAKANVTYCIMEKWESQAHLNGHLGVGCDAPAHMKEWFKARKEGNWGPEKPGVTIFFCNESIVKDKDLK